MLEKKSLSTWYHIGRKYKGRFAYECLSSPHVSAQGAISSPNKNTCKYSMSPLYVLEGYIRGVATINSLCLVYCERQIRVLNVSGCPDI